MGLVWFTWSKRKEEEKNTSAARLPIFLFKHFNYTNVESMHTKQYHVIMAFQTSSSRLYLPATESKYQTRPLSNGWWIWLCTPQHNTVWRCCWEAQGFPRCLVLTFHKEVMAAQPHVRQKRPIFTFVSALNTQGVWLVRGKHFFYHKRLKYFSQCTSDCQCQYTEEASLKRYFRNWSSTTIPQSYTLRGIK